MYVLLLSIACVQTPAEDSVRKEGLTDSDPIGGTDSREDSKESGKIDSSDSIAHSGHSADSGDSNPPVDTDPPADAAPDFALADVNTVSARYGEVISPRDYLQQVSGWYFIHST